MVRDPELIRKIMLNVQTGDPQAKVDGYDNDVVNYHKAQLIKQGLLEGTINYPTSKDSVPRIPDLVMIWDITPAGHDVLAVIASDTKWNHVKAFAARTGRTLTVEGFKLVLSEYLKHKG